MAHGMPCSFTESCVGVQVIDEDASRKIWEDVKIVLDCASDLRRTTMKLSMSSSCSLSENAEGAWRAGQARLQEAKNMAQGGEGFRRTLTQQKLADSLDRVSKELEQSWKSYQIADLSRSKRLSMTFDLELAESKSVSPGAGTDVLEVQEADVSEKAANTLTELVKKHVQHAEDLFTGSLGFCSSAPLIVDKSVGGTTEPASSLKEAHMAQRAGFTHICQALCAATFVCAVTTSSFAFLTR